MKIQVGSETWGSRGKAKLIILLSAIDIFFLGEGYMSRVNHLIHACSRHKRVSAKDKFIAKGDNVDTTKCSGIIIIYF